MDFPGGSVVKTLLPKQGAGIQSLVGEDPLCHMAKKADVVGSV